MKHLIGPACLLVSWLGVAACTVQGSAARLDGGEGGVASDDADGDGISDDYEGRASRLDTDSDGTPDYLDDDSDGDGIFDAIEGGAPGGMPLDADHDGTPDFQDLDADDNGIPDAIDGADDLDHDQRPDADDLDDDNDGVSDVVEIGGDATAPADTDGDGTPDFHDLDSDHDAIADRHEGLADTDRDGVSDRVDLDSDDDHLTDAMEAGDADLATSPIDTDGDHVPDFRDTDSDDDGLSDASELVSGTSPTRADTDGDGVTDLVEVVSGTDPANASDSPRTRGNFVFVEPYRMPPDPMRDTLDFATNIRSADLYFLIDTTGSMQGSIASVQTSLSIPSTGIIDQVRAMIPDTNFGVGDFKDHDDAYVFHNDADVTASATMAQAAVNGLSANGGGDLPEGEVPALYAIASGMGVASTPAIPDRLGCPPSTFGYPCFRSDAVPIVAIITDAAFHNGRGQTESYDGYTDYATMLPAILANHIRVIGVAIGTVPVPDLEGIAADSDAVDANGAPLVTVTTDGEIPSVVVDAVRTLSRAARFDISTRFVDDTGDAVDTWGAFVDHIEANTAGDSARGCAARPAIDTDDDGVLDTFESVTTGEHVCFDIFVKQNDSVMETADAQLLGATIEVLGDGFTRLDSRRVYFLVPPVIPPAGCPDCPSQP